MKIDNIVDSIFNHDDFAIKNKRKVSIKAFLEATITSDNFNYITVYSEARVLDDSEKLYILVSTDFCFYSISIDKFTESATCVSIKSLRKIEYETQKYNGQIKISVMFDAFSNNYLLESTDTTYLKFFDSLRFKSDLLN